MSPYSRQTLIYSFRKQCSLSKGMTDAEAAALLTVVAIDNNWCESRPHLKGGSLLAMTKSGGSKPNLWMLRSAFHYLCINNIQPSTDDEKVAFEEARILISNLKGV